MSTPFPTEEAAQTDRTESTWDPWSGPVQPKWYSGMGFNESTAYLGPIYRLAEAAGSGAAKGMAVLNGLWGKQYGLLSYVPGLKDFSQEMVKETQAAQQDFRGMAQRMTPDPATTGSAVRILHGVGEGAYLMSVGSLAGGPLGAAGAVGGAEGGSRYQELREQGVDRGTAAASGALAGVTSAAGALMPAAYGESLLANVATGALSNTAFGVANRYLDHKILEAGGYPEMAAQQKALDGTQMLVDAALGATFGVLHHYAAKPEQQDAALTANLALRDRQTAPGVPTDLDAANAHQAALEKAQADLMEGKPVDVSDTGVDQASFLSRPSRDILPERRIILNAFKESGLLDEEANLRDLERQFEERRNLESRGRSLEPVKPEGLPAQFREEPEEGEVRGPIDVAQQALAERPDLEIANEKGEGIKAADALERAQDDTDWKSAVKAAADCFARRGG